MERKCEDCIFWNKLTSECDNYDSKYFGEYTDEEDKCECHRKRRN